MNAYDTMDTNAGTPRADFDTRTHYQRVYQDNVDDAVRREAILFQEKLPVRLSEAEVLDIARRAAELSSQHGRLEEEMKATAAGFKSRLAEMKIEHMELQHKVRTGIEHRSIQCEKTMHRDLGEVTVTRLDTGRLVETRPMTPKERQTEMEL